jgi:hypothetical protein
MSNASDFHITYASGGGVSVTLANPINMTVGQSGNIVIFTNGTSNTITFGSYWKFIGGTPITLSATNTIDIIKYYIASATEIITTIDKNFT